MIPRAVPALKNIWLPDLMVSPSLFFREVEKDLNILFICFTNSFSEHGGI